AGEPPARRPGFRRGRAAGRGPYKEHMPLRSGMAPQGPSMRIYTRVGFGGLADIVLVDDRQYRSHQPCAAPGRGGATIVEDCQERLGPGITMFGEPEGRWHMDALARSRTGLDCLAPTKVLAQLHRKPGPGPRV